MSHQLLHPSTPYLYVAAPTAGRQLAIPDIHGCVKTLKALVERIDLQRNDQLFCLGDYINKGNDSLGVISYLLELKQNGFQVFTLRGNHEQMLLEKNELRKLKGYNQNEYVPSYFKANGFFGADRLLRPVYADFFANMYYYIETEQFYFVHAGFNLNWYTQTHLTFWEDWEQMLWIREFSLSEDQRDKLFKGKQIIIGHTPTLLDFIEKDVLLKKPMICLDNGCFAKSKMLLGNLLCLDLTNWILFKQQNID